MLKFPIYPGDIIYDHGYTLFVISTGDVYSLNECDCDRCVRQQVVALYGDDVIDVLYTRANIQMFQIDTHRPPGAHPERAW